MRSPSSSRARSSPRTSRPVRASNETVDSYGDLRELMDDADEFVDQSNLDDPTEVVWAKLSGLMTQITPYYDARPFGS